MDRRTRDFHQRRIVSELYESEFRNQVEQIIFDENRQLLQHYSMSQVEDFWDRFLPETTVLRRQGLRKSQSAAELDKLIEDALRKLKERGGGW